MVNACHYSPCGLKSTRSPTPLLIKKNEQLAPLSLSLYLSLTIDPKYISNLVCERIWVVRLFFSMCDFSLFSLFSLPFFSLSNIKEVDGLAFWFQIPDFSLSYLSKTYATNTTSTPTVRSTNNK